MSIPYRKSTSTPRRATVDSGEVSKLGEDTRVSKRNVDHAVVSEGAQGSDGS